MVIMYIFPNAIAQICATALVSVSKETELGHGYFH